MSFSTRNWEIFWEIPECPPFLTSEPARFFTQQMAEFCGKNFSDCILEYRNNVNIWYLDADEWSRLDEVLFQRIIKNQMWGEKMNRLSKKYCPPCLIFFDKLIKINLTKLSNQGLLSLYKRFMKIYIPAHASGHPANVLEMKNQRLSSYLKKYISGRLEQTGFLQSSNEVFITLVASTFPMSAQIEAKNFYRLATIFAQEPVVVEAFKTDNISTLSSLLRTKYFRFWKMIERHHARWCWTIYNYEGPAEKLETYLENWVTLFRQGSDPKIAYQKIIQERRNLVTKQRVLIRKLSVDSKHQKLFAIASDIIFLKALRKDCIYKGAWVSTPLYTEVGKRLGLTVHQTRFIFYSEMSAALINGKIDSNLLNKRIKETVMHQRAGKKDILSNGTKAIDFVHSLNVQEPQNSKELHGQCAYPGKITGTVKIVNTPDMMGKMEQGNILVAYATQPNLLPAMKKAGAFVTDHGGITCHAAIVAREWKVPCVVGTGNASKILKDNDIIEIDAESGIIKKL